MNILLKTARDIGTKLGTTARGIAPCYRDKYARIGKRVRDCADKFNGHIWDEKLWGNILCEGAQGFWLDINTGNYPYITSVAHCHSLRVVWE